MKSTNYESPNQFWVVTRLVHVALLLGIMMFAGATIFLRRSDMMFGAQRDDMFLLLALTIGVVAAVTAQLVHRPMLKSMRNAETELKQLQRYQAINLVRWSIMEGACLLAVVGFFMTGNLVYVLLVVAWLIVFVAMYPSPARFDKWMETGAYQTRY